MEPVHYLLLAAVVLPAALVPVRRAFARRNAGRTAQVAFKRAHGARIAELLAQGEPPDPRRGSPWIPIRFGAGSAMFAAARLHRGRLQAGVHLLDVILPVEIWHADPDELDVDVLDGVDRAAAEVIARQLGRLGVDSLASGQLGAGMPPILRVQFDTIDELPDLFAELDTLVQALVALTPEGGAVLD